MPTPDVRVKDLAQSYAPLESLAQAIGSMLTSAVRKKQAASTALSSQISKALLQSLEAPHRSARMLLIKHLVGIEVAGLALSKKIAAPSDLIGTAQTAPMLVYSRPQVAILIDQLQLKGATVSAGGHHSFG